MNDSLLSVRNASGRQVSLLNSNEENNNNEPPNNNSPTSFTSTEEWQQDSQQSKRKYHCIEPGCNKSFTTSGHLARHNRIHTGEKNFPCLFPGCQSRFSRQDNMMQHYRTHMSPKSRRSQKRGLVEDIRPRPRLHAHHRIRSDPVRVEPPLTIDQHLSNYHESLKNVNDNPVERYKPVRFNFPLPLSSIAKTPSNLKKSTTTATTAVLTPSISQPLQTIVEPSPTPTPTTSLSRSSSTTSLPSFQKANDTHYDENNNSSNKLFYQHRPLTFTRFQQNVQQFPYTLLHPDQRQHDEFVNNNSSQKRDDRTPPHNNSHENNDNNKGGGSGNTGDGKSASSGGLLQLAHIVSTFG